MAQGPDCHGAVRQEYDRELVQFAERCREFAQGEGVPAALAHSESGARQWVSDELARRATRLAAAARRENTAWLTLIGRQAVRVALALPVVILLLELATLPFANGWGAGRTATLIAFIAFAGLFALLSAVHSELGGALCYLTGVDGRLSLPRTLGLMWISALFTALVYFGVEDIAAGSPAERSSIADALSHPNWQYLVMLAVPVAVSAITGVVAAARMRRRDTAYLPGQRSQLRDLLVEESGFGSLACAVWLPLNLVAVAFLAVGLAKNPYTLPRLPAAVLWLSVAAAVLYCAIKLTEVHRPVLVSVVRVRRSGEMDGPIRPGDEIEIRGLGFAPRAAAAPDQLARIVVKLGPVHLHVPIIPDADGAIVNPTDTSLTVPIPYEVEPGAWTVRVVTASGLETTDYPLDILPDDL
ncbi:MAG TPA: hypothetical protein VGM10_27095 [Actinocrinis sp.]